MDAKAGYGWLLQEKSWGADKIIVCGESLGSYPAARLAAECKTAGLMLEAPFTAFTDLAAIHYPALPQFAVQALLMDFRFDNLSLISKVKALFYYAGTRMQPVLILWGRRCFKAAQPKQFLIS
jgi:hypothetical protein